MQVFRFFGSFIFIIGVLFFPSCKSHKQSILTKKYSPIELKQDVEVISNVMLKMHPVIGIYNSKTYYHNLFSNLQNQITDSLTEKQFRFKLKIALDELHCGHTEIVASKQTFREMNRLKLSYSPFVFLPVREKMFLLTSLNKKQDSLFKKGAEITHINGLKTDSILRYCKLFISGDGYNQTAKDHYLQLGFNSYYPAIFNRPDSFKVDYKIGTDIRQIKYPAVALKSFPALPIGKSNDSLFKQFKRAKIKYRYLGNKKNLLVKIEKFSHRGYNRAYRKLFKRTKRDGTENLIIDLRNNGGGSLANTYRLLSYLMKTKETQTLRTTIKTYPYKQYTKGAVWFKFTRMVYKFIGEKQSRNDTDNFVYTIKPTKKRHYDGKIMVLINGGSFSASCLLSAYLKKNGAIFIGEETGGTQEGSNAGITPYYKLPNTHLRIRVPAFRIVHDVDTIITGRGIMPDYPIEYTFKDITSKRDLELMKVKELLKIQ